MYPEIPADTSGLSAAELRSLAAATRAARKTALATDKSRAAVDRAKQAGAEAEALELQADELDAEAAKEAADQAAADAAAQAEADAQATDTGGGDEGVDGGEGDEGGEGGDDDQAAGATTVLRGGGTDLALSTSTAATTTERRPITPDVIHKVDGDKAVDQFENWAEFAEACAKRARTISRNTSQRFEVGRIVPEYPEHRKLGGDAIDNLRRLDTLSPDTRSPDEVMADLCAPFTPYYNLACMNTTRRPVAASLDGFEAPRGGVLIYPSPTLADVEGSAGIWTREDDADLEAVKNECARITCATPEEFAMYGVYYCLTVKNMLALTFPELLAAYLNRAAANYSRVAEIQLLDAMGSGVPTITANPDALGYGASVTVATQVMTYLALYREQQRWDDVPFEGWGPRWLRVALQVDLARRRQTDGRLQLASGEQVDQMFRDAGIEMTWYLDDPSWGVAPPAVSTGGDPSAGDLGALNSFPSTVNLLVAPEGKYRMIDRAQLSIGVTGNNWYRDNASNSKNEVTYFFENYEGVVDTTSCPSNILEFEGLCYNGVQIDDVALDCLGAAA